MSTNPGARRVTQQSWREQAAAESPRAAKWNLNSAAFEQLLAALDSDRERAGAQYRQLHLQLVKFFEWQGSGQADRQADEVLDRVTRRIANGERIDNLQAYAYGVAKLLLLERRKELEREKQFHSQLLWFSKSQTGQQAENWLESDESLRQRQCFDSCLGSLTGKNRTIILGYYDGERQSKIAGRRQLAKTLGADLNALRVRAYRIRTQLENCVLRCLEKAST